ncbi:hypothetical protein HK100_002651 [Physocladia obscura]|uniref:Uncharacterized protein n=1 Tax=Physocladia obscura TaxID=109957 RepID=A0AAD5T7V5_9FUNG|nr:hypothetical protein HK100_002651 [Physocladia obscura]
MAWGKKPSTANAVSPSSEVGPSETRATTAPSPSSPDLKIPVPEKSKRIDIVQNLEPHADELKKQNHHVAVTVAKKDRTQAIAELMDDTGLALSEDEMEYAASPASTRRVNHTIHHAPPHPTTTELKRQLEIELNEKATLEETNEELRSKVAALKRKLLSSISLREKENTPVNRVPVSVEANMNLKYQFQKRLLMAKEDYASLLDENRKLAARIKELESNHSKREVHVSKARLNEVLMWKKKYKELEAEKHKVEENFAVFVKKLEKAEAQRDKIAREFNIAQIQFAQNLTYDDSSLENLTEIGGSNRSLNRKFTTTSFRPSKYAKRKSKTYKETFEYDDVVRY